MWNLFNCYMSGRHDYGMWCEPGAIPALRPLRQALVGLGRRGQAAQSCRHLCRDRRDEQRPRRPRAAVRPRRRQLGKLTVRARRDHNNAVPVPRISKEDLKLLLESGASPVLVDARLKYPYEHSTVKLPGSIRLANDASAPAFPREKDVIVYDSDPNELASSEVAAKLIRLGYKARAQGRHRRLARRQSADRNQRGSEAGHARTWGTERLAGRFLATSERPLCRPFTKRSSNSRR